MRAANLLLKFLLELAAFAAFAYWGANTGEVPLSIGLAILAPAVAIGAWAIYAAPKSTHRLPSKSRIPFELMVLALAAVALLVASATTAAALFAAAAVVNAALLTAFGQWDR